MGPSTKYLATCCCHQALAQDGPQAILGLLLLNYMVYTLLVWLDSAARGLRVVQLLQG